MTDWNRRQLWGDRDAAHRRTLHAKTLVLTLAVAMLWLALSVMTYACYELQTEERLRSPVHSVLAGDECVTDDDCALMPAAITCCGECPPVPPFEAVTRASLADYRRVVADACAPETRLCDPPSCAGLAAGCDARAICRDGRCQAAASEQCLYRGDR